MPLRQYFCFCLVAEASNDGKYYIEEESVINDASVHTGCPIAYNERRYMLYSFCLCLRLHRPGSGYMPNDYACK